MTIKNWTGEPRFVILITMNFRQTSKRIFTAALAVWMSGIVLVVCCQMPTANAETDSCPLAKKGDCAKMSEEHSGQFFGNQSPTFDCCTFPAKIFDKARKLEIQPPTAEVVEAVKIAAPKISLFKPIVEKRRVYQSFIRNHGSTHLQNCVFRI
ncbi:MAG: hypothetical protein LH472_10535 [Pyrinomonadaceae bacterium]|nr:hypothetical protein [Pyrinomonadaceae bacterium]